MERDAFLDHLAERLGRPRLSAAPSRAADECGAPAPYARHPLGPETEASDRAARFAEELEALGGNVVLVAAGASASDALAELLARLAPTALVTWARSEFAGWGVDWLWDSGQATEWPPGLDLAVDVGITTVDCLVANTGTLVLHASVNRPRSVSLLPTAHIALVRESQLVDRLGQALEAWDGPALLPSAIHCISGPSRSADIENDLSIGVHGPAAVYVLLQRGA